MSRKGSQHGTTGDELKPLNEITLADVRQKGFARFHQGQLVPLTLDDLHARMSDLHLNESVPERIRTSFDTARNLYIYSWFVYRFGVVAELHVYATLEAALGLRIAAENLPPVKYLKPRLKKAIEKGWVKAENIRIFKTARQRIKEFTEQRIAIYQAIGETIPVKDDATVESQAAAEYLENLCESIPGLRNALAHGSSMLHNHAALPIEICCDLINQLFPEKPD
jgi:hypothetical protein